MARVFLWANGDHRLLPVSGRRREGLHPASHQRDGKHGRLFTGQVLDASTGLYYYKARYYDPQLGQFTQPDSLLGRPMSDWEKMAAWYNTGVINLEDVSEEEREGFWKTRLEPYLVGTYRAMQAIENLDLLGVKSRCQGDCFRLPVIGKRQE